MQLGEISGNIFFIAGLVLIMVANIYLRRRREMKTPMGVVVAIFSDMSKNQQLAENFSYHWQSAKFRMGAWRKGRVMVDFLPQELLATLAAGFDMAEEFNQRLDAAKRSKSDSYLSGIELDKIKASLAKGSVALQEWIRENMNDPQYKPRRRGLFG